MNRTQSRELSRAAWGTFLIVRPAVVLDGAGARPDGRALLIARILGARHLVQATGSFAAEAAGVDRRVILGAGSGIDAVHAVTALVAALVDLRRRKAALVDAFVASVWAASGARELLRLRDAGRP